MMKLRTAMPPTTPPTMAPVLLELEDVDAAGAVVELVSLSEPPVEGELACSVFEVRLAVGFDGESVVDCSVFDGDGVAKPEVPVTLGSPTLTEV